MANDNKNRRQLYDALKNDYSDIGSWEEFNTMLNDEGNRKMLYDAVSKDFEDAGSWDEFNGMLAPEQPAVAADASSQVRPDEQTTAPKQPQKPTSYKSVRGEETRDGQRLRYYTGADNVKVYHPDDVTAWREKTNPYAQVMAGRRSGPLVQSAPNYGSTMPTSDVRNEFKGKTANSAQQWETEADNHQRMANAAVRRNLSAQQNAEVLKNDERNRQVFETAGLNTDYIDAAKTLEGIDANGMPVSGSRNVITETTDEEGNKIYIDADGNSSYSKEELEAYQSQRIGEKASEIESARKAASEDRRRIAAEYEQTLAEYDRQIDILNASDPSQIVTPEASMYMPMTANADVQRQINDIIKQRRAYQQMMADKYPDIITFDTWQGVKNAVISAPKAAARIASDGQIALGALIGSEKIENYGRQVRAGIDKYEDEHPLAFAGAGNEIVEGVHHYGGMTAAALAQVFVPGSAGVTLASALGKLDMARMILEGAADQGRDARDNGASDYAIAGYEMANALIWGTAGKVIGTPFSKGVMKRFGDAEVNNMVRVMEQMRKNPAMAREWQNTGELLQRAAKQLGLAEVPVVKMQLNQIMNGTLRGALDMGTAQTLCTAMSMMYRDDVGLKDVGAAGMEGLMTGAMFGLFFGAAGSVRPLLDYRRREASNQLVERGAEKPVFEAEDEVTLLQLKNGMVGRLVGVRTDKGTMVIRMANGASVEIRPEEVFTKHTAKKSEFMNAIDEAISEGVKSAKEAGEGITGTTERAETHIKWQDVQREVQEAGFSPEERAALERGSTRRSNYGSDEHRDLAVEYLTTKNEWEGMMNTARIELEKQQRQYVESMKRRAYNDGTFGANDGIPQGAVIVEATLSEELGGGRVDVRSGDLNDATGIVTIYDGTSIRQIERRHLSDITTQDYYSVLNEGYQDLMTQMRGQMEGDVSSHLQPGAAPFPIMIEGGQVMAQYKGEQVEFGPNGEAISYVTLIIGDREVTYSRAQIQQAYVEAALEGARYAHTKSLDAFDRGLNGRAEYRTDEEMNLVENEPEEEAIAPVEEALTKPAEESAGTVFVSNGSEGTAPVIDAGDGMLYHEGDVYDAKIGDSDVKVTVKSIDMVNGKVEVEMSGEMFEIPRVLDMPIADFNEKFSKQAMDAAERAREEAKRRAAEEPAADAEGDTAGQVWPAEESVTETGAAGQVHPAEEGRGEGGDGAIVGEAAAPVREGIPVVTDEKGRSRKQYHLVSPERTLEDIAETDGYKGRGDAQREFVEQKQKLAAKYVSDHKSKEPQRKNYEDPEDYAAEHAEWKAAHDEMTRRKKYWDNVSTLQEQQTLESSRVTHGALTRAIRAAEDNPSNENKAALDAARTAMRRQIELLDDDTLNDRARNVSRVADQMEREGRDTAGQDEYLAMSRETAEVRGMDMDEYAANIGARFGISDRKKGEEAFGNIVGNKSEITTDDAIKMQMALKGMKIEDARALIDDVVAQHGLKPADWTEADNVLAQQREAAEQVKAAEEARRKAEAERRAAKRREEMADYGEPQDAYEFVAMNLPAIDPESFRKETGYSGNDQRRYGVGIFAKAENGGVSIERAAEILANQPGAENWLPMDANAEQYDTLAVRDMILDILQDGNPKGYIRQRRENAMKDEMDYAYNEAYGDAMDADLGKLQSQYKRAQKEYNDKVATTRSYANSQEGMVENARLEAMKKAVQDRGGLLPTAEMVKGKKQKVDYTTMGDVELDVELLKLRKEKKLGSADPDFFRTKRAQEIENAIDAIEQEKERRESISNAPFSVRDGETVTTDGNDVLRIDTRTEEEKAMTREELERRGEELRSAADEAYEAWQTARSEGRSSDEVETLRRKYGNAHWQSDSFAVRNGIYQKGLNDNGMTAAITDRQRTMFDEFGKKMEVPIVIVPTLVGGGVNGKYDPKAGVIWVAADALGREGDPDAGYWGDRETMKFVVGHEATHHLEKASPEAYKAYIEGVKKAMGDMFDMQAYEERVKIERLYRNKYKAENPDATDEEARDYAKEQVDDKYFEHEVAANYAGRMFERGMFEEYLAEGHVRPSDNKEAAARYSDDMARTWMDAANRKTAEEVGEEPAADAEVQMSIRKKPEPEKKGIGYKVFYMKDGKLYPPMVANPDGADTPVGVWLDADVAPIVGESKTGRPQVKQGGKGTQGGSGQLAFRPGWHLGEIPYALQFNHKDAEGKRTLFPKNFVWAEVEYAADVDYQEEANAEGMTENGKFRHSYAGLKRLPEDGYYRYRTNPNHETDPWIITGAMKVNRILDKSEVDQLVRAAGREPQRVEGEEGLSDQSLSSMGTVAEAIAAAESETNTNPTEAQKKAGNYRMGHVKVDGYDISIENPKGSTRSGKDADGNEWSVTMNNTYGYIRGTEGVDGDHIDVFLSDDPSTGNVYVIDQVNADGTFDEHKVMYGFNSAEEARENYLGNYSEGWQGLGTITEVSKEEFKKWVESSHRKTKPFAEYKSVRKAGYSIRQAEPVTDEKIAEYDAENNTEMRRFIDYLNGGRRLSEGENGFFHVGNTGDLLQRYGIEGRITIGTKSVNPNRHTNNADHGLTADEWFAAIEAINTPLAISKYTKNGADNQFRIYTEIKSGDKIICLGANVNQVGRDVRLTNIRTGYKRNLSSALNEAYEELLYPTRQELTRMIEQSSYQPNSDIYAEPNASNVSEREGTKNIRNEQGNGAESAENVRFSVRPQQAKDGKTLYGAHNISEDKLRKALKLGGLANPSTAVADIDVQPHTAYGEISLLMPSTLVEAKTGKNVGTYDRDAWTPLYPRVEYHSTKESRKNQENLLKVVENDELRRSISVQMDYFKDGNSHQSGLAYVFLKQMGIDTPIERNESKYGDTLADIERIFGDAPMNYDEYLDLPREQRDEVTARILGLRTGKDVQRYFDIRDGKGEATPKMREFMQRMFDEGVDYRTFESGIGMLFRDRREAGTINIDKTIGAAYEYIRAAGMATQFKAWEAMTYGNMGYDEKFQVGFKPDGTRIYKKNTLANVSAYMKKQGRNASEDHFSVGAGMLLAQMANRYRTLEQMRQQKGRLAPYGEGDGSFTKNGVSERLYNAARFFQSDKLPVEQYDQAWGFLEDAIVKGVDYDQLEKEFDEYFKYYDAHLHLTAEQRAELDQLREDCKNIRPHYFETKFERPVGIEEFASAVVPATTGIDVKAALRNKGLDVVEYDANTNGAYESAIRTATEKDGIRFSTRVRANDPFYSNAAKAVEAVKQEKATADQWLAMIQKNGGLKAEEDKWIGLSEWLRAEKAKAAVGARDKAITKQDVEDFIMQNCVKVEEELYTETSDAFEALKEEYNNILRSEGYDAAWDNLVDKYGDDARIAFDDLAGELVIDNAEASSAVLGTYKQIDSTRIDYTTEGLDNKREVALIVPTIEPYNQTDEIHFGDAGDGRAVAWVRFGETTVPREYTEEERADNYAAYGAKVPDISGWKKYDGANFVNKHDFYVPPTVGHKKTHIADYSDRGKYVLTVRDKQVGIYDTIEEAVNAYRDMYVEENVPKASSRVLVIDEIKSKRHQDGREMGYESDYAESPRGKFQAAAREMREYRSSMAVKYGEQFMLEDLSAEEQAKYNELLQKMQETSNYDSNGSKAYNVPDAPFRKNWHELAMKRMLRLAAEEGYDKVAWTKGMQQIDRYSSMLQGVVRDIQAGLSPDGKRSTVIRMTNNEHISLEHDVEGNITRVAGNGDTSLAESAKTLSEVVGQDLAEKILAQTETGSKGVISYTGDDITIGNNGMRSFYDKMLPQFMQKYGKKWGVKVGEVTLPDVEAAGRTMWSIDVTPEMKESVMQGQPMFSVRGRFTPDEAHKSIVEPTGTIGEALKSFTERNKYEKEKLFLASDENIDYLCSLIDIPEDLGISREEYAEEVKRARDEGTFAYYDSLTDRIYGFNENLETLSDVAVRRIIEHESIHAIDAENKLDPRYAELRNAVLQMVNTDARFSEVKDGVRTNHDVSEWLDEAIAYTYNLIDKKWGPDADYYDILRDHPEAAELLTDYRNTLRNGKEQDRDRGRYDLGGIRRDSTQEPRRPEELEGVREETSTYSTRGRRFIPIGERREGNSEWEKATRHLYTELERIEDIRDDQRDTMPKAGKTPEEVEPNDIHEMSNFELRKYITDKIIEEADEDQIPSWLNRAGRKDLLRYAELYKEFFDRRYESESEEEYYKWQDDYNERWLKAYRELNEAYKDESTVGDYDDLFFRDLAMPKYYDTEAEDEAFWNGSEDAASAYRDIQKKGLTAEEKGDIIRDYLEADFHKKSGWEEAMFGDEDVTYSPEEAEKLRAAYNDGVRERVKSMLRIPGMQPKDVGLTQKECDALNIDMEGREMEADKTFYEWNDAVENVTVHTTLTSAKKKLWHLHEAAKKGDVKAAYDFVEAVKKAENAAALANAHPNAIVVPVMSDDVAGVNMIPMAYAWYLNEFGLQYTDGIVRVNNPKHTGATKMERFFRRARFEGEVIPGQEYIIVDDHITMGGSVRDLKDYIQSKGGKVVAVSALTSSPGGTRLTMSDAHREYFENLEKAQSKNPENKNINEELQELGIAEDWRALTDAEAAQVIRLLANARGGERLKEVCERKLRTKGADAFDGAGRQSRSRQKAIENRRGYRRVSETVNSMADLEDEAAYGSHYGSVTMNNYGYLLADVMDRARDLTDLGIGKVEWDAQYEGQQDNVRRAAEWIESQLELIAEAGTTAVQKRVEEARARLNSQVEYMTDMFADAPHDSLMRNDGTLYAAVGGYKTMAQLAHGVKEGGRRAINKAATLMADLVPEDAVLVPIPGHKGRAEETLKLAEAIARLTGNEVADVLEGARRETQYERKQRTGESLTGEELGFKLREDAASIDGKRIVFIDNVVATGTTAEAARKATGGRGMTVALADDRVKNRKEGVEGILATTFGKHKLTEVEREERRQRRLEQKKRGFVTLDEMAEDRHQAATETADALNDRPESAVKVEVTPDMTPEEVTTEWLHSTLEAKTMRDVMGAYYDRYEDEVANVFKKRFRWLQTPEEKADYIRTDEDLDRRIEENQKWWGSVKRNIAENMERAGVPIHFRLTDGEAKYILWKTYADTNSPIGAARATAFRKKLGIGEFASPTEREQKRYEYEYRSLAEQSAEEDRRIEKLLKNGPLKDLAPVGYSGFGFAMSEMGRTFRSHFDENAKNIPTDEEYRQMTYFDDVKNVKNFVRDLYAERKPGITLNKDNISGFIYKSASTFASRKIDKHAPQRFKKAETLARIDELKEYRHILEMAKEHSTEDAQRALDDVLLNVDYAIDYYDTLIKNPDKVYKTTRYYDDSETTHEYMERPRYSARERHPFDDIPGFGEPTPPRLQPGESIMSPEYQERMRDYEEQMRAYETRRASDSDIRLSDADLMDALYTGDTSKIDAVKTSEDAFLRALAEDAPKNIEVSQRQMRRTIRDSIIQRRKYIEVENYHDALFVQDIIGRTTKEQRQAIPYLLEGNWVKDVPERLRPTVEDIKKRLNEEDRLTLSKYLLNMSYSGRELTDEARDIFNKLHAQFPDYRDRDLIAKGIRELPVEITPELESVLADVRTWFDSIYDKMMEEGLFNDEDREHHIQNYVTHIWDKKKSDQKAVDIMENYTRMSSPYAKQRLIRTLEEGLDLGLKMKYDDIAGIMMEYGHYANEAIANRHMLQDLEAYEVTWIETAEDGTEIEHKQKLLVPIGERKYANSPDYVVIDNNALSKYRVWRPLEGMMNVVYGPTRTKGVGDTMRKVAHAFDVVGGLQKKINLSLSFFHHAALSETAVGILNPAGFAKTLFKNIIWDAAVQGHSPAFNDPALTEDAVKHLVQLGATQDYAAKEVNALTTALKQLVAEHTNDSKYNPLYDAAAMADFLNKGMDTVLWDFLHDGLKIYSYQKLAAETRRKAKKEGWDEVKTDRALDEVGQFINDTFGGQHWDVFGYSPQTVKWLRRFLLSPDWTLSTLRQALAPLGVGQLYEDRTFWERMTRKTPSDYRDVLTEREVQDIKDWKKARQKWGVSFWITAMASFMVIYNGLNAWNRYQDEQEENEKAEYRRQHGEPDYKSPYKLVYPDGMKWYDYTMYGNVKGKNTVLFTGRMKDGRERYARWGKQFRELPELFYGRDGLSIPFAFFEKMAGKANPVWNTAMNVAFGIGLTGWENDIMRDKEGWERTWAEVQVLAASFLPYSIPTDKDTEFVWTGLFMPSTKGYSAYKAKRHFKTAILAGDEDLVKEVYKACTLNKLNADQLLQTAMQDVQSEARKQMIDGVRDLNDAVRLYNESDDVEKKRRLANFMNQQVLRQNYYAAERDDVKQKAIDFATGKSSGQDEKGDTQYILASTAADVMEDNRLKNIKQNLKGAVDKYNELQETEPAKAAAYYKQHKDAIEKYYDVNAALNDIRAIKREMHSMGATEDRMNKIREIRANALK